MIQTISQIAEYWARVNAGLIDTVRGLNPAQLDFRARDNWPIWAIAAHTASPRIYWLCSILKQPGRASTPFHDEAGYG